MRRSIILALAACLVACGSSEQPPASYPNLSEDMENELLGRPSQPSPPTYNSTDFAAPKNTPRAKLRQPGTEIDEFNRKMREVEQDRRIEQLELQGQAK